MFAACKSAKRTRLPRVMSAIHHRLYEFSDYETDTSTGSAELNSAVSPNVSRHRVATAGHHEPATPGRLEICDTADYKSALRGFARHPRIPTGLIYVVDETPG